MNKPTFEIIKLRLRCHSFHIRWTPRPLAQGWFLGQNLLKVRDLFYFPNKQIVSEKMKTKLIAIGSIIVIIFFISRIKIKRHLRFFKSNSTLNPFENPTKRITKYKDNIVYSIPSLYYWIYQIHKWMHIYISWTHQYISISLKGFSW